MKSLIKKILTPVALASSLFFSSPIGAQQISQPPKRQVLERIVKTEIIAPEIEWERSFGGNSITKTKDNNYFLTKSFLSGTGWVSLTNKINSKGDIISTNTENCAYINQIIEANNGDMLFVGLTAESPNRAYLGRRNNSGVKSKKFSESYYNFHGTSLLETNNGDILFVGTLFGGSGNSFYTDAFLIQTDKDLNEKKRIYYDYKGDGEEYGAKIKKTKDGGYVFLIGQATMREGFSGHYIWLQKLYSSLNTEWEKFYGGTFEKGYNIEQVSDSGYVIVGENGSIRNQGLFIKTDSLGNKISEKILSSMKIAKDIRETPDSYFIAGKGTPIITNKEMTFIQEVNLGRFTDIEDIDGSYLEGLIVCEANDRLIKFKREQPPITPPIIPPEEPPVPEKNNLVFITHGLNIPFIPPSSGKWHEEMRDSIKGKVDDSWDVISYDWTEQASIIQPFDSAYEISVKLALSQITARELGKKVGKSYSSKNLEQVQLIGNSCGAWLISGVADEIRKSHPNAKIQITFLDAYALPFMQNQLGNLTGNTKTNFWSDNYFTYDILTNIFTQWNLKNSHNVNINNIVDPDTHSAPRIWYQDTITTNPLGSKNYGFVRSLIHGDKIWNDNISKFPLGKDAVFLRRDYQGKEPLAQRIIRTSENGIINSVTGGITLETKLTSPNPESLGTTSTQSVWIDSELFLKSNSNYLNFDYQFEGLDKGYFGVYFNNNLILLPHQNIHGTALENSGDINIAYLKLARNFLGIRFTPFNETPETTTSTAKVFIGNPEYGNIYTPRAVSEKWEMYR